MGHETYNTKRNPIITKNFNCSTAHITKEDSDKISKAIKDPRTPLVGYQYLEGCFIYVASVWVKKECEALKAYGFSDAFINLIKVAAGLGCKYLQLDCDEIEYEDLPTFEW
jgi:hypothetical protein